MKTYDVVIRAVVTKTIRLDAETAAIAEEDANQIFSVASDGMDESYEQDTLSTTEVTE